MSNPISQSNPNACQSENAVRVSVCTVASLLSAFLKPAQTTSPPNGPVEPGATQRRSVPATVTAPAPPEPGVECVQLVPSWRWKRGIAEVVAVTTRRYQRLVLFTEIALFAFEPWKKFAVLPDDAHTIARSASAEVVTSTRMSSVPAALRLKNTAQVLGPPSA